ncbi:MAG TPA: glycosyltransferase family 39 protein [Candidatus Binatia bacterium]|nr:glycosyltransferase family 39 protein [Candidatus Binatia bacterium]
MTAGARRAAALVLGLFAAALALDVAGIGWGLPSAERSRNAPLDVRWYAAPQTAARLYETAPYESYNPDEGAVLNALSHMRPRALDLNPHYFNYPTLWIYATGAALAAAAAAGAVRLEHAKAYYLARPEAMAAVYRVGRLLAATFAACGVVLVFVAVRTLFDAPTAALAGLALALTPLWVRDAHFMLVNVPAAVWMAASAALAARALARGSTAALVASGLAAGLAASTKYPAGAVVALPLLVAAERAARAGRRRTAGGVAAVVAAALVGFVAGTPYAVLAPREALAGIAFEARDKSGLAPPGLVAAGLVLAQGTVLAAVTVAGLGLVAVRIRDARHRFVLAWVAAGLAQRLVSPADPLRYLVLALPPLAVAAGLALAALRRALGGRVVGTAAALLLLAPALGYALDVDRVLCGPDVRTVAAGWIAAQGARAVAVPGSLYFDMPPLDAERRRIVDLGTPEAGAADLAVVPSTRLARARPSLAGRATLAVFRQGPLALWTWPVAARPSDWAFTFLDVYVFGRTRTAPLRGPSVTEVTRDP